MLKQINEEIRDLEEGVRILTLSDLKKLYEALSCPLFASFYVPRTIQMMLLTGCRLPEILTLTWRYSVDFTNNCFYPETRSGNRRVVPLSDQAQEILGSLSRFNAYIFVEDYSETHYRDIGKIWKYVCYLVGVPYIQLRSLHHSFAALSVQEGADPSAVLEVLGYRRTPDAHNLTPRDMKRLAKVTDVVAQALG